MGLILDSNIIIDADRKGQSPIDLISQIGRSHGPLDLAISVVTIVEFDHGIYRSRHDADRQRRKVFSDFLTNTLLILPVTLEVAQLAGRIDGEQAAIGIAIPFEDLLIGATALHYGDSVLTNNLRHMRLIPNLTVLPF